MRCERGFIPPESRADVTQTEVLLMILWVGVVVARWWAKQRVGTLASDDLKDQIDSEIERLYRLGRRR